VFIQLVQSHIGVEISSPACFKLGFATSAVREILILSGADFAALVVWMVAGVVSRIVSVVWEFLWASQSGICPFVLQS
jgi:hypothetical protein